MPPCMAQEYVNKNRSKDNDGRGEMGHQIRDPRTKINGRYENPSCSMPTKADFTHNRNHVGEAVRTKRALESSKSAPSSKPDISGGGDDKN